MPSPKLDQTISRPIFKSVKKYDHSEGLSCCFRQWRADHSHCQFLHGYALAVKFVFATYDLDDKNWCFDFGGLKDVRAWLHSYFDHTTIVAEDDPHMATFESLAANRLIDLRVLPAVGCEAVAQFVHEHVSAVVKEKTNNRVWLESVEISEHSGNSASYQLT